ncbi:MAG: enoyl-CoA hydratase-related protein, partial [Burkholderiaceae bacterium]|nr:enoyl-CoA hydratase-related protein [Burkholderiaceae bacterium]
MSERYARYQRLKFDRPHPAVLRITLSSPLKLGAMDALMHKEVSEIWNDVESDSTVDAIIMTGEGRSFSAGGDLHHERKLCDDYGLRMQTMREARNLVYGMLNCSKPIVTAARGWAVGAGLACLIMADVSIAAKDAKFSDGHLKIGVAAGDHATIIWPLLCGMAKAKYYLL